MNFILVSSFICANIAIGVYLWFNWENASNVEKSYRDDVFIPTNEWKPIREDQPIPKGLHVRINLQTHEREAKLMEDDEKLRSEKANSLVLVNEVDNLNYAALKQSLKNIKNEIREDENKVNLSKKNFRTFKELKKELSESDINIKTDMEVLDEIFKQYNEKYKVTGKMCSREEDELIDILKKLENLLHQVDNAEEFSKRNGMAEIILPCLSSNSTVLRMRSARVLGSAAQNNVNVQIIALRAGVMTPLLKTIALNENYEARASSIFALSCLIRSLPFAEMKLIDEGGLSVLLSLFDETSSVSTKLQMKIVNFFYDLTMEKINAELAVKEEQLIQNKNNEMANDMEQLKEKLRQYTKIDLKKKLIERDWCMKLGNLFVMQMPKTNLTFISNVSEDIVNHDLAEKMFRALLLFVDDCHDQFRTQMNFLHILENLLRYYERSTTKDDLYQDIYDTIQQLDTKLKSS